MVHPRLPYSLTPNRRRWLVRHCSAIAAASPSSLTLNNDIIAWRWASALYTISLRVLINPTFTSAKEGVPPLLSRGSLLDLNP